MVQVPACSGVPLWRFLSGAAFIARLAVSVTWLGGQPEVAAGATVVIRFPPVDPV
ncbi:hypothetical protein SAMN05878503_101144 [Cereibacter ovatus]|uniref:Uncharacterized protein n=1 Tax=Cereibacter ovatus TaxID=439529 RepID=A0A285CJ13_9RHOB|nr:hypothetical protein [Cereibacter ovatus]SNX67509.1 hypothetical protein SAMN05878503_101144 [Cereibacter ovatus]